MHGLLKQPGYRLHPPDSPEAESAKRVLESLKSAHPQGAPGAKPGA